MTADTLGVLWMLRTTSDQVWVKDTGRDVRNQRDATRTELEIRARSKESCFSSTESLLTLNTKAAAVPALTTVPARHPAATTTTRALGGLGEDRILEERGGESKRKSALELRCPSSL